jgi:phosphohistidine phosphatase
LKQLLLLRHGKSSWRDPALTDLNRPLKKRGIRDAAEMAHRLERLPHRVERVLMSPARRVIDTVDQMTATTGFGRDIGEVLPELYTFSYEDIMFVLKALDNSLQSVAIAGHNPAMTDLLNFLCLESVANVPTCGMAFIRLDLPHWREIMAGSGSLECYDFPKSNAAPD